MSLYQKYRPLRFHDVFTQKHITEILQASLKKNSVGHAYLFVGTRGSGKTSLARIFARALNCQNSDTVKKTGEPCNECESCLLSLNSNHPDIIEMDAASNRGIEEIRTLKDSIDFMPSVGINKVYIIDEVHMMTKEAFNALLKTLEEPPKHVIFIMCTTEVFKIPPTIISRSQVFEFRFASTKDIIDKIDYILGKEGRNIDTKGKDFIAKLGRGSFRDTESILEKVLNSSESGKISFKEVLEILGFNQLTLINEAKDVLYSKDLSKLQAYFQNNLDDGSVMNFAYQLSDLVYEDIIWELKKGIFDKFKIELFDFLVSLDKDLKNTSSPKIIFIAKILNFISNFTLVKPSLATNNILETEKNTKSIKLKSHYDEEKNSLDTSAILQNEEEFQNTKREINKNPKPSKVRISKIDFLNFLKDKNTFLYKFFKHKNFVIRDNKIIIDVTREMEKDLLKKHSTLSIIQTFGQQIGQELAIVHGEPSTDNKKVEKKIKSKSKTVEDLSDEEISQIFKIKEEK